MNPIEAVFGVLERALGYILAGFYAVIPSYGLAIIFLTLVIRTALYPLTAKSTRSMRKMQLLQPHMKKLQEKYKDDRQRLSEEQMALFKANKVSPLSGCLPLLIQMPFLFAMFRVLAGGRADLTAGQAFNTGLLPAGSALAAALASASFVPYNPGPLNFLGLNLGLSPSQAFQHLDVVGIWGFIMQVLVVLLVVASGVFQQRQLQARRAAAGPVGGGDQQQMMQTVGKVMPIAFGVFSIFWPAGLNLYWLTGNLFQIGQQYVILRKDDDWEPVIPESQRGKGQRGKGDRGASTKPAKPAKPAKASKASLDSGDDRADKRAKPRSRTTESKSPNGRGSDAPRSGSRKGGKGDGRDKGSAGKGSAGKGSAGKGSAGKGSADKGSADKGSADTGAPAKGGSRKRVPQRVPPKSKRQDKKN